MNLISSNDELSSNFLGQLLVVVHHTSASSSLCYEPELIPDPLGRSLMSYAHLMDLGSGVVSCGKLTTITMDEVLLTVISLNARPTGSSVAQLLIVQPQVEKNIFI
jgi:hypothetical protein